MFQNANKTILAVGALLAFLLVVEWFAPPGLLVLSSPGLALNLGNSELGIEWGDLGKKLISSGVIDPQKFEALYENRGGLTDEMKMLLYGETKTPVKITRENANFFLNLLWGLGLANKNPILEEGPMTDYGEVGNFASTGGWILAKGDVLDHYSKHQLVSLEPLQQRLVEEVSKNIYRPCCDNPTYFPDCNHGMAMLGLLELLAVQGATEKQMYESALAANSLWFPSYYSTIEKYVQSQEAKGFSVSAKVLLGYDYSSATGFSKILQAVNPEKSKGGVSCGV